MSWRYHVKRARTGVWLNHDAQMLDVNIAWVLTGPGEMTARLDAHEAKAFGMDGRFMYEEWSSIVYAEKNGRIRWGGVIDGSEDIGNGERNIHIRSLSGYAKGVKYTNDLTRYYQMDAFDLVRLLWSTMQANPMSNINMTLSSNLSGVLIGSEDPGPAPIRAEGETDEAWQARLAAYGSLINDPYELAWYNTPDFGEEVEKIMAQAGADYVENYAWNVEHDDVINSLDLYWPTAGTRRNDLRFVEGENLAVPPAPSSEADEYGNHVIALGAGEERHMLREEVQIDDGRLKRHIIAPAKDLYSPSTLNALARSILKVAQNTIQYDSIEVYEHPNAPIGDWNLGDEIKLETFSGYYELNEWVKVVGWAMSPSREDMAVISVVRLTT